MQNEERVVRLRAWVLADGQHFGYQDQSRRKALIARALAESEPQLALAERWGLAQAAMLREIDLHIGPDDLFAGHFCPHVPGAWEEAHQRAMSRLTLPAFIVDPAAAATVNEWRRAYAAPGWIGGAGEGHHTVDFHAVLTRGVAAMAAEAEAAAAGQPDLERAASSRGMAVALRGFIDFAQRHAEAAATLAGTAAPARAAELRRMVASCRHVPGLPAAGFFDALQAIWLTYLAVGMTESPSANSLGALDRLLWPYYRRDLASGALTEDEAGELLAHFLLKCGSYAEGQALTLGGLDDDGRDAVNDLTRLFLRVILALGLPEPIIAFRVHDGMRADDLDLLARLSGAGNGQPSYYHEPRCRAMLAVRGTLPADLARLSINSCMGVVVGGAELDDMWAAILLLPLALEVAASGGRAADGSLLPELASCCREDYRSLDTLFDAYQQVVARVAGGLATQYRQVAAYRACYQPNPLLSGLLDACRTRGLDRYAGGPRYHSAVVEGFGWANVSDALVAIETLVFQRGEVTLPELLEAARTDYVGREELRCRVRACPKYGNDHPVADAMARRVLEAFIGAVNQQNGTEHHVAFRASLHTLYNHVAMGPCAPAGLDGRPYGAPLNKQLGPSVWAAQAGPTAVLASAARLPVDQLPGGQALDISLPAGMLDEAAGRARFLALLRGYFSLGGADLQVNTLSPALLRAAQADPASYPHLIVRIAGYSEHFLKLSRPAQDDLILRLEAGL
jgi:formate C-acetyltransferase